MTNQKDKTSPLSKLSPDEVRAIRRLWKGRRLSQVALAFRYGVSQATISNIVTRKVYRRVRHAA